MSPRRLKKRHVAVVVLVLVVAGATLWAARVMSLTPGLPGKYNEAIVALVEAGQADATGAPNAWADYLALTSAYTRIADRLAVQAGPKPEGWAERSWPPSFGEAALQDTDEAWAASRRMIDAMRAEGIMPLQDRVQKGRRFVRPIEPGRALIFITLGDDLAASRGLARMHRDRMLLAGRSGDQAEVISAFSHILTLADVLGRQATLIERLTSIAIMELACSSSRQLAHAGMLRSATMRSMLGALGSRRRPSPTLPYEVERYSFLDTLEWTHSDDGQGDGLALLDVESSLTGGPPQASGLRNLVGLILPRKSRTRELGGEIYAETIRAATAPTMAERESIIRDLDVRIEKLSARSKTMRTLVTSFGSSLVAAEQAEASVTATMLTLGVAIFRAEQGRWPDTLAQLHPGALPSWPPGGEVFRLRITPPGEPADAPSGGRAFIVYHLGLDGLDNGGKPHPEAPSRSFMSRGAGTDYVPDAPPPRK